MSAVNVTSNVTVVLLLKKPLHESGKYYHYVNKFPLLEYSACFLDDKRTEKILTGIFARGLIDELQLQEYRILTAMLCYDFTLNFVLWNYCQKFWSNLP